MEFRGDVIRRQGGTERKGGIRWTERKGGYYVDREERGVLGGQRGKRDIRGTMRKGGY